MNQILFVIQRWPKEWYGYANKYLKIFILLYILRKQKKNKPCIYIKPEFELQRCFKVETENDIISWFCYRYPTLSREPWKRSTPEIIQSCLDRSLKTYVEMCGNGIFSTSECKLIQHKRAFLWESLEPKFRSCSRNENSVNENKISYCQITKTLSFPLNIHQTETLNTKQKKIMIRNNFLNLYSANFTFLKLSNSGTILQIDESTDS